MAKKTIKKVEPVKAAEEESAKKPEVSKVRVYSRDRSLVRVLVFSEDELGDMKEETVVIEGNKYIELPADRVGWDIANKVKSGLLRIRQV